MTPRLIVALDVPELSRAQSLIEVLRPLDVIFKIGYEAYYAYGKAVLDMLQADGAEVFLDLKLHDIPRTVGAALQSVLRPGLRILTVHALGGEEMMRVAVEAAEQRAAELDMPAPEVFAVTLLTSLAAVSLPEMGLMGGIGENVVRLAALARNAGCAGVVCSPHEASDLKAFFGSDFRALCPGIRPSGTVHGDQARAATPFDAVRAGADYLVVGRPITQAADPLGAAQAVIAEMRSVIAG